MKRFLLIIGALLAVAVIAIVVLPFVVPADTIKNQLAAQVEAATGRRLHVDGDLSFSVVPRLAVDMNQVGFANLPGAEQADMVVLKNLRAELKLLPLLTGAVEIDRFVLVEPQIHLAVDANGTPNWQFGEAPAPDAPQSGSGNTLPISELKLGDIRLQDGLLTYSDATSGASERLENINLQLSLADIRSPLRAEGALDYKGETVELDLDLQNPDQVLSGARSPIKLDVRSPALALGFEGAVENGEVPGASGTIALSIESIRDMAAWLATPIALEGEGLRTLQINGKLEGSAARVAFTEATVALDDITGNGEIIAELGSETPRIDGRLDLETLDLNPYLPKTVENAETEQVGGDAAPSAATGWSEEPIVLPPLTGMELAFDLTLGSLKVQDLKLDRTVLALRQQDGVVTASLQEIALYGGRGDGELKLRGQEQGLAMDSRFNLAGLQALPFLQDAMDLDLIEGTAEASFALTATGSSQRALIESLNGDGRIRFADGAVRGINIAAMVRNARTAFLDPEASDIRKTDFAELGGTFAVADGIVTNKDMAMQAPALRINGSGTVDLPRRELDYRLEPKAAATLKGQGGKSNVAGILVPITIKGSFEEPKIAPDLSGVVEKAIEDPEAIKEQVEQLSGSSKEIKEKIKDLNKDDAKELLDRLTGEGSEGEPAGDKPADLLKNLLR